MTQVKHLVLVAEKEYAKGLAVFEQATDLDIRSGPADEAALAALVMQTACRAVVLGVEAYDGPLYEALSTEAHPALMARFGVGHDSVDKTLARQNNILVTNTPGVLDQSVAELTFWLLGAVLRSLPGLDAAMKTGKFPAPPGGMELAGRRLLLVGFGGIARVVARIATYGFGMHVVATGRCSLEERARDAKTSPEAFLRGNGLAAYTTEVQAALPEAEIVSIHLASNEDTLHYVDSDFLAGMREDAILLNTSRGPVLDECALYDALATGQIRAAGLDVFEQEPYVPMDTEKDLRTLENVVLTPHVGSNTLEANTRMAMACVENIRHFFRGAFENMTRVDQ